MECSTALEARRSASVTAVLAGARAAARGGSGSSLAPAIRFPPRRSLSVALGLRLARTVYARRLGRGDESSTRRARPRGLHIRVIGVVLPHARQVPAQDETEASRPPAAARLLPAVPSHNVARGSGHDYGDTPPSRCAPPGRTAHKHSGQPGSVPISAPGSEWPGCKFGEEGSGWSPLGVNGRTYWG